MNIVQCENLSISFNKTSVLNDLSFTVDEGDYLCIVGENGSGKSTLIKCLLGLEIPDKGHIIAEESLFNHIGYLPQQTTIQRDFPATVFISNANNLRLFESHMIKSNGFFLLNLNLLLPPNDCAASGILYNKASSGIERFMAFSNILPVLLIHQGLSSHHFR